MTPKRGPVFRWFLLPQKVRSIRNRQGIGRPSAYALRPRFCATDYVHPNAAWPIIHLVIATRVQSSRLSLAKGFREEANVATMMSTHCIENSTLKKFELTLA
jgi:hypothetical protein